jgi:hypothetical protein
MGMFGISVVFLATLMHLLRNSDAAVIILRHYEIFVEQSSCRG